MAQKLRPDKDHVVDRALAAAHMPRFDAEALGREEIHGLRRSVGPVIELREEAA